MLRINSPNMSPMNPRVEGFRVEGFLSIPKPSAGIQGFGAASEGLAAYGSQELAGTDDGPEVSM